MPSTSACVYDWPGVAQPSDESLKVTASALTSSGAPVTPRAPRSATRASHRAGGTATGVPVGAIGPGVAVWNGGRLVAEAEGVVKLVADAERGVLVGATVVAPYGGEVVGLLTLAVHAAVPLETLRGMHYAYPTFHRAIAAALDDL